MVMLPTERQRLLADAYAHLSEKDKSSLPYPQFHSVNSGFKFTCRGLNAYMEHKRIELSISAHKDVTRDYITRNMQTMAQEQRQLEVVYNNGFLIDLPIKAMLDSQGLTTCHLVEMIRDMKQQPNSKDQTTILIGNVSYIPNIYCGTISGVMTLSDSPLVLWNSGRVQAENMRLPTTMQQSLIGKTVREIIDHTCFEGLTIRKANGFNTLHLTVNERPIPAGANAVL